MNLPGPVVYVDASGFPGSTLRAEFFIEVVGITVRIRDFHVALDDFRVPNLMKAGRIVFALRMLRIELRLVMQIFHRNAISAVVAIVDDMERLVQIADKMNEVADGLGAFQ